LTPEFTELPFHLLPVASGIRCKTSVSRAMPTYTSKVGFIKPVGRLAIAVDLVDQALGHDVSLLGGLTHIR